MHVTAQQFVESLGFVYPIAFATEDEAFPYYCGGTCFALTVRGKLFIVTARHCLEGHTGHPSIQGPDGKLFPVKQSFNLVCEEEDNDWSDVVCLSTHEPLHWPNLDGTNTVDFDALIQNEIVVDETSGLVVKGYPASHTKIEPPKIFRKPALHLGLYGGKTGDAHCHFFNVLSPPINDPDGLSGSPVVLMDGAPGRGVFPTLLGMVTRGGKGTQILRFIGVNILIRSLLKLSQPQN